MPATGHAPILRIQNVGMAKSVAGNRRLPLIAGSKADPGLRGKPGFRGKCRGNDQAGKQDRESKPEAPVVRWKTKATKPQAGWGARAAKAIYREKMGVRQPERGLRVMRQLLTAGIDATFLRLAASNRIAIVSENRSHSIWLKLLLPQAVFGESKLPSANCRA